MNITRAQVIASLAELRTGRSRANGNRAIRSILRQFGGGVSSINELAATHYAAVYAAVAIPTFAEFYGTVTDNTKLPPTTSREPAPPTPSRIRSPLVASLEALLAARIGKPRSRPNYIVNTDAPQPEYPAGRRMS
jgi:hypothetical protein